MNNENLNLSNLKDSINFLEVNQSFISQGEPSNTECDHCAKIIVVGEHQSGKTSLIHKALNSELQTDEYLPTMGFEFFDLIVRVQDKKIKMKIWDTCGQEVYRSIVSSFYKGTDLAFLVFSLSNRKSFESLKVWLHDLREHLDQDIPILLIGTKLDLEKEKEVNENEVNVFMKENMLNSLYFTSIKNDSCSLIFKEAAKKLYELFEKKGKKNDLEELSRHTMFNSEDLFTRSEGYKKPKEKCCK